MSFGDMRAALQGYEKTHAQNNVQNKEKTTTPTLTKTKEVAQTTITNQSQTVQTPTPTTPQPSSQPTPPQTIAKSTAPKTSSQPAPQSTQTQTAPKTTTPKTPSQSAPQPTAAPSTPVTQQPATNESTKKTETQAPAKEKPKPTIEQVTVQSQKMLHTSVAKYRYFGTATGCCAKICRIFKAIMFFLFGQFGLCLGKAQDKKIGIGMENSHIANYENKLDDVVASLPRGGEKGDDAKLALKFKALYLAYKMRQRDVATLNIPVWKTMHLGLMADLKAKIEKHNQKNPTKKIDAEHWLKTIGNTFNLLEAATAEERANGYLNWYAKFITPEHIAKDGLKLIAEFADHYCQLHNTTHLMISEDQTHPMPETLRNRAALLLRADIVANETQVKVFSEALSAISKKKDANKEELTKLFNYFTGDLNTETDQAEFLKSVFAPKAQKAAK